MSVLWTIGWWSLFVAIGYALYVAISTVDQMNRDKENG